MFRASLVYFFGVQAESWTINDRVIELIGEMLLKEHACSKVVDTLPRPGLVTEITCCGNYAVSRYVSLPVTMPMPSVEWRYEQDGKGWCGWRARSCEFVS